MCYDFVQLVAISLDFVTNRATLSKLVPRRPNFGKEFHEVATITQVVWNLFENILHPHTRFNAGILAGSYQRVHYRCAICGGIIAAEEPVFSSQGQRANGSLNGIVVDGYPAVIDITGESRKKSEGIFDCLADPALRKDRRIRVFHPFLEDQDYRI